MNRLESLRLFCLAAESANFRDAATRAGVSPQVVTRVIGALEEELGEPLFHRSTRGVRLTEFGEQLAASAAEAVAGLDRVFQSGASATDERIGGLVRIAAPSALGRRVIAPALAPLLAAHPGLRLDLRLSEVVADVVDGQIDVGVRIGPLRDSRFVARPASGAGLFIVAAPSLVERVGAPASLESLLAAPMTVMIDRNTGRPWPWMFKDGQQVVPPQPALVTDDPEAECEAVLAGAGFGQLPGHLALPLIRDGRLVAVLDHLNPAPSLIYVYRPIQRPTARVRLVFDALCELLRDVDVAMDRKP